MSIYRTVDLNAVRPIMEHLQSEALALILEGERPCEIYVDRLQDPRSVMIWDKNRTFYCAGDAEQRSFTKALASVLLEHCFPMMNRSNKLDFVFCYAGLEWEARIQNDMIPDRRLAKLDRRYYIIDPEVHRSITVSIPEGFTIEPFTEKLFHQLLPEQRQLAADMLEENQITCEHWMMGNRFGYCVLDENQVIVSACLTDFVHGDICELGIETDENDRRKGFGTAVAHATAAHAFRIGIHSVGWDCWDDNVGSFRTVERIGGRLVRQYTVLTGWFNSFDHRLVQAYRDWTNEEYDYAATQYEEALTRYALHAEEDLEVKSSYMLTNIPLGWFNFNAARAQARVGEISKAISYLQEAIRSGWISQEKAMEEESFQSIKQDLCVKTD
ncbi:GNAT family N-acetyltransferase [Paenibacillus sp. 1001270B_150601_E10]|uniref:GNAT family N-acetyltransferase n=1 Tax=Paenibacillus sp. 1001270B_150601_E10 TaxID=2787079 RepID=UPI00189C9D8B|nr:GNAT family N-acetyltransferase [Paenibacillus sp. 1001270B_150601_E10]